MGKKKRKNKNKSRYPLVSDKKSSTTTTKTYAVASNEAYHMPNSYPAAPRVSKIAPIEEEAEAAPVTRAPKTDSRVDQYLANKRAARQELPPHRNRRRYFDEDQKHLLIMPGDFVLVTERNGSPWVKGPWFATVVQVEDSGNVRVSPLWKGKRIISEVAAQDTYNWYVTPRLPETWVKGFILAHKDHLRFVAKEILPNVDYERVTIITDYVKAGDGK